MKSSRRNCREISRLRIRVSPGGSEDFETREAAVTSSAGVKKFSDLEISRAHSVQNLSVKAAGNFARASAKRNCRLASQWE